MTQTRARAPKLRAVSEKHVGFVGIFGFVGMIERLGGSLPKNDTVSYPIPA